jgi:aminopeptidase N
MHEHGEAFEHAGCGRRGVAMGAGRREPFAFPGTVRRYSRDRVVDVRHTRLEIAVDPARKTIEGVARHTVSVLDDGTERVVFDAAELVIDGVTGDGGKKLAFEHVDEALTVHLGAKASAGTETTISIAYHGKPRRGLYFVAPDEAYPRKPLQAWTQGQDEDSRYWFPCFDYPNEKATTEVVVTAPSKYSTLSNGALVSKEPGAVAGTTTWHWRMAISHVAYLVTLVVGEFDEVSLPNEGVPLPVYVPRGHGKDVERCFGRTPALVKLFGERFGVAYPYEKYAQVVVSDFIFGGMENTTATTLTEYALYDERAALDYDADDLVAHELGHQWWGDLLTCRDWSHAWLNEGFATWCESVAREGLKGKDEALHHLWAGARRYFAEDGGEYRRPIVCKTYEAPIDVFDRHLYEKGGCVLHMLRGELGEDAFWRSIRTYATANRGRSVLTDDLRRAIEEATGRNFEWYFDQWVFGAGHPEFKASWTWDEKAKAVAITLKQTQKGDEQTADAFRGTLGVEVTVRGEKKALRLALKDREHTFHVPLAARPDAVRFDPDGWWLASWSLDVGLDAHRKALASDPSVPLRLRAAAALSKDSGSETVQALARAVRGDAFWGVRAEAAAALGTVRTPAAREALLAALPEASHPKVRRAVVAALGAFRDDAVAADAVKAVLEKGDPSIFVEAEAAEALGRTRVPGARKAIEAVLEKRDSWAESIRAGCVRGLGHLASEEALPALERRLAWGNHPRVRAAAAAAMAEIGSRLRSRDAVREKLEARVDDADFRVQMSAIAALRALGDEGAIPALRRAADQAVDGRVRRACRAAARRLDAVADRSTELARLSDAVEALRRQAAELSTKVERLEAKAGMGPKPTAAAKAAPKKKPARKRR